MRTRSKAVDLNASYGPYHQLHPTKPALDKGSVALEAAALVLGGPYVFAGSGSEMMVPQASGARTFPLASIQHRSS